jgi:hypothetical protein
MRVNNLEAPLGLQETPRLSWALELTDGKARNQSQSAYQVECVSADGSKLWDSGKTVSSETLQVPYAGSALPSRIGVHWRVNIWDQSGAECGWSDYSTFEMALLKQSDWVGDWVTRDLPTPVRNECTLYEHRGGPRFRTQFAAAKPNVTKARLYVTGLGYYKVFIDGKRVGEQSHLDPGQTAFDKRVLYAVHDVASFFNDASGGDHAIGIELGNGWWRPLPLRFWGHIDLRADGALAVGNPMFKLQLELTFSDGGTQTVASDPSLWKAGESPTLFNNIYLGEVYDARLESPGWASTGFDDSTWAPSLAVTSCLVNNTLVPGTGVGVLQAQSVPPVMRIANETLTPRLLPTQARQPRASPRCSPADVRTAHSRGQLYRGQAEVPPTGAAAAVAHANDDNDANDASAAPAAGADRVLVFDAGRNFAGTCSFTLVGPPGAVVSLRYGELLHADGSLNPMTSVAGQIKRENKIAPCQPFVAYQTDTFTLAGRTSLENGTTAAIVADTWAPQWSWHGFRYIEMSLPNGVLVPNDGTVHGSGGGGSIQCFPMMTAAPAVSSFDSSDGVLSEIRTLAHNTFKSNLMSVQSDCPHRERFGYTGDAHGCGEAAISNWDFSTFYAKRVQDANDASRANGGFTETAPFVGISDGGLGDKR